MKQPVYPLYAPQDEAAVRPVLDALRKRGVTVRDANKPKRGDAVVFFLSENMTEDSPAAAQFFAMQSKTKTLIPVLLDGSTPPTLIAGSLMARHTIDAARYDTDELAERIEEALEKRKLLPWIVGIAAAAAAVVVAVVLIVNAQKAKQTDVPVVAEPTVSPVPTPVPRIPAEAGIKPEDLEKIHQVFIIGDRFITLTGDEGYARRFGIAKLDAENFANRFTDENGAHWQDNETGEEIVLHQWADLDFLRYMTNLQFLDVICVEGTLPDLSGLQKLDFVRIADSQLTDLNGLSGTNLYALQYENEAMDFSPLSSCKRLKDVHLELINAPEDLDSFAPPALEVLFLSAGNDNGIVNASGLAACVRLQEVSFHDLALHDLSCLSHNLNLTTLSVFNLPNLTSLNGLQEHKQLATLRIDSSFALNDLNALIACPGLRRATIQDFNAQDLFFLSGASELAQVELRHCETLRTLHGLENHTSLYEILCDDMLLLSDISALENCTAMYHLQFMNCPRLVDVTPIVRLPKMRYLELYGAGPDDVNYLEDVVNKDYFNFGVAQVQDWSGLAAIKRFSYLSVTDPDGSSFPYLAGTLVDRFELWYRRGSNNGSSVPIDYSSFPKVYDELYLHGVPSLVGLPEMSVTKVLIDSSDYLTSLDGIEGIKRIRDDHFVDLRVEDCPRLNDWTALEGASLARLELSGLFSLPSAETFSKMQLRQLRIASVIGLTDLSALSGLPAGPSYRIELFDLDGVTDLSPLYRLKGESLSVPAHLGQQAQLLADSGNFREINIEYPDGWWQPYSPYVKIESLDELDTLPSALLAYVQNLNLVGDRVFYWDDYEVNSDWSTDPVTFTLRNRYTDEEEIIEPGTMTDLSRLSVLTGLKQLDIRNASLTSLDGIQYCSELEELNLNYCPNLADASAAFTMQSLRVLRLNDCYALASIDGVQNLSELEHLEIRSTDVAELNGVEALQNLRYFDLQYTPVTDFSPLAALPGDCDLRFNLDGVTVETLLSMPDGILSKLRRLCIAGDWVYNRDDFWYDDNWQSNGTSGYLVNNWNGTRTPIGKGTIADLSFLSRFPNLTEFRFACNPIESLDGIEQLGQLEEVEVRTCPKVTDVSVLFTMQTLHMINLNGMRITSIAGIEALPHLTDLTISDTQVTDLSPIALIDVTEALENRNGFNLSVDNLQDRLDPAQYQVLAAIPEYASLNVFNTDCVLWMDAVKDVKIHNLHAGNCNFTNDSFRQFIEQHPELEYIKLSWTSRLKDISPLLSLTQLETVCVSHDMKQAIASLGDNYPFRLEQE